MYVAKILEFPRLGKREDTGVLPGGLGAALGGRFVLAASIAAAAALAVALWLGLSRRDQREPVRAGGRLDIVRCPVHGIAYDAELEECTECAKSPSEEPRWPSRRPAAPTSPEPFLRPLPRPIE